MVAPHMSDSRNVSGMRVSREKGWVGDTSINPDDVAYPGVPDTARAAEWVADSLKTIVTGGLLVIGAMLYMLLSLGLNIVDLALVPAFVGYPLLLALRRLVVRLPRVLRGGAPLARAYPSRR